MKGEEIDVVRCGRREELRVFLIHIIPRFCSTNNESYLDRVQRQ